MLLNNAPSKGAFYVYVHRPNPEKIPDFKKGLARYLSYG